jgi:hypothetical protein
MDMVTDPAPNMVQHIVRICFLVIELLKMMLSSTLILTVVVIAYCNIKKSSGVAIAKIGDEVAE